MTPENDNLDSEIPKFLGILGISPIAEEVITLPSDDDEKSKYLLDLFLLEEMFRKIAEW